MSWINKILEFGSTFDWISPTVQTVEDRLGGMDAIAWPRIPGMSGLDVQRTLERAGVRVGRTPMIVNGDLVMTVDNRDRALAILERL